MDAQETLSAETAQRAMDELARIIIEHELRKGEKQHGKELARNTAREV